MKSNKVYIYNLKQADYYMRNGVKPLDKGIHNVTGRRYYVFDYYETRLVYDKWCKKCDKIRGN